MNPLVSIVIPSYNYGQFVSEAVESVLAQTYSPIEVIVVDDGSTDNTREVLIERFGDRIRYIYQENKGLPGARNTGIRNATGSFLAFLDADDLWLPTKLEKQMAVMSEKPEVGLVYCSSLRVNTQTGASYTEHCRPDVRGDVRRKVLHRNCIAGSASAALIRRECFDTVGLFDETLRSAEDWDMWIRLSRHYQFDFVPEALIQYRMHGSQMSSKLATMSRYQLEVMERAFREDPIDGGDVALKQRALAYIHFDAGDGYLALREFAQARKHFLQAIALTPQETRYYKYLVRALIRQPVKE
jgi:glycosyltransferase involved in cell wall biosynthesis